MADKGVKPGGQGGKGAGRITRRSTNLARVERWNRVARRPTLTLPLPAKARKVISMMRVCDMDDRARLPWRVHAVLVSGLVRG